MVSIKDKSISQSNFKYATTPENVVYGANMGPTWVLPAQIGPMLAPWTLLLGTSYHSTYKKKDLVCQVDEQLF